MKRQTKTLIFSAILVALLAAGLACVKHTASRTEAAENAAKDAENVALFDAETVNSITYQGNGEVISLTKADDVWWLSDNPAENLDQSKVTAMITAL